MKFNLLNTGILFTLFALTTNAAMSSYQGLSTGTELAGAVSASIRQQHNPGHSHFKQPIIYGGSDFSRSIVASAEESIWAASPKLLG